MKLIKNILQLILLPLFIAGVFFLWSYPRITSDYNFNSDELIYLERTKYAGAYFSGDFNNKIWSEWGAYDQPQLTNYLYSLVPGDRSILNASNSPCETKDTSSFYNSWGCLDGPPINTWDESLGGVRSLVTNARTLALLVSSLALASTYYLGYIVAGPVAGILASLYLGYYSFFRNLSTMIMMDQLLLLLLNLQAILFLVINKKPKNTNNSLFLVLGAVTALALSTKFSAAIPSLFIYSILGYTSLLPTLGSLILAGVIFISLHPNLWNSPILNLVQMLSWRTTQLSEAPLIYQTTSLLDSTSYALTELFSSYLSTDTIRHAIPLVLVFVISLYTSYKYSKNLTLFTLFNLLSLILIIPVKWNRYLLPVIPLIAVSLATLPTYVLSQLRTLRQNLGTLKPYLSGAAVAIFILSLILFAPNLPSLTILTLVITFALSLQGYFVTRAMLHTVGKPKQVLPAHHPKLKFSLLIPAKDEAVVIGKTLSNLANLSYPKDLYEVIVITPASDEPTLREIEQARANNPDLNLTVIPIDGLAHSKSYSLNVGLSFAKNDIISIFDAEDEVNPNLLKKVNDYWLTHPTTHAVQAPVHLVNVNSSWFSALNSIEYYYWFASVLPFLSVQNTIPLGGNTVFIHKSALKSIGGYDETCLTEDADIGIRLSSYRANIGILEDPALATLEETPVDELGLIKQRARWDQGYLQVLGKQNWRRLGIKQQLLTVYILTQPIFRHLSFLNMVFAPLLATSGHIPLWVALISFIPAYFLFLQLGLYQLGLIELCTLHKLKLSLWRRLTLVFYFLPYQALLFLATTRALYKLAVGNYNWDKTTHHNAHRESLAILEA